MTRETQIDCLCRLKAHLNNGVIISPWNKEFTEALDMAIEALKQPEIVTCKTCIHWIRGYTKPPIGKIEMHYCPMVDYSTEENYFCPDGERGEN